jgi:hypothetical protein
VTKIGDFVVNFLREFESIFKKALTRESGAYGKLFDEKNQRSKSRVRVPIKKFASGPYYLRKNFFYYKNIVYKKIQKQIKIGPRKKLLFAGWKLAAVRLPFQARQNISAYSQG